MQDFEQLESDYSNVLQDMDDKYKAEFEKLYRFVVMSRENEVKLMKKCQDLASEVQMATEKIQTAAKTAQTERSTIASLKKEIKKAWKMVEATTEKENRAKEAIQSLKNEVQQLQSEKEANSNDKGHAEALRELNQRNEHLAAENAQLGVHLEEQTSQSSDLRDAQRKLIEEKNTLLQEQSNLKDLLATKKSENDREIRNKERAEKEMKDAKLQLDEKMRDLLSKDEQLHKAKDEVLRYELYVKEQKHALDKTNKDQEVLNLKLMKLDQDFEDQVLHTTRLLGENQQCVAELKTRDDQIFRLNNEIKSLSRARDALSKKLSNSQNLKHEEQREKESAKSISKSLEHEVEALKKGSEDHKKHIEDLMRERDLLNKNIVKAANATQRQISLVKLHDQAKEKLEQEIAGYKEEASKQRKIILSLEKERDRWISDAAQIQKKSIEQEENAKMLELQIFDCKKKIAEADSKLKQQQNLYENVRSDRNFYSKNLVECKDEITELKRKLKIMSHQIEQLKEEISVKEASLVKEHFEHLKVDKEKEIVKIELSKLKQQHEAAQQCIQNQQAEEQKLRHIITEADSERIQLKKEYEAIVQERDILGTQLVRRNDELALQYEKIKIQQSTLNKGQVQYRERMEDIRVLKLEVKKLKREKTILQNETANVVLLRDEVYKLQRDMLRERTRVRVLEEELENPMNIHRWRKLEGADPTTFELIQKIQTLQKRLIAKTEQVVEKEIQLQTKEKLYKELKMILSKQPGPELAEQLSLYQQTLKTKTNQLKALASEVNMYRSETQEYKFEIQRLTSEVQTIKKKYYKTRKFYKATVEQPAAVSSN